MQIVLDDFNVAFSEAEDTLIIRLSNVPGLGEDNVLMLPFSGDALVAMHEKSGNLIKQKPIIATPAQAQQEARSHGFNTSE